MGRLVVTLAHREGRAKLASGEANDIRAYAERVAKYVPAEVLAGYVALLRIFADARPHWHIGAFVACLLLTPLYLWKVGLPGEPKALHLLISMVAFVVWSYSIGGDQGLFGAEVMHIYEPSVAAGGMVFFTLVSGLFAPRPK